MKVARCNLKSHLESECTNSNLVCTKCHGNYKASEEHCCISHLRALIEAGAAGAAEDRCQTNEILENYNDHVTRSMKILEERINEQEDDNKKMLEAILGLNNQIASFQNTKLSELTQMAQMKLERHQDRRIPDGPSFNLKIAAPLAGPKMQCRKIGVQGAQSGKYFEFPDEQKVNENGTEALYCSAEFKSRILTKVSACVGVGIYSLRLHFDDGTQSPIIGSHTELTSVVDLGKDQVTQVGVRAWKENYVQTVTIAQSGKKGPLTIES